MLPERVIIALVLLPFVFWAIAAGGWLFSVAVAIALSLAGVEFAAMFRSRGHRPAAPLLIAGIVLLVAGRFLYGFAYAPVMLTFLLLLSVIWHVVDYELGAPTSGTDWALTIAGMIYLGWIGAYLISLRELPGGEWWLLIALPSVWIADMAAYFLGRAFGRHKLAPRLSPKKTWEGYLSGILAGGLSAWALGALWRIAAGASAGLSVGRAAVLGVILGALAPFGDLGISMVKRELNVKDSGSLLPGHGGALDRIDSWLWGGALGFYIINLMIGG
jgi:phosphatidate cytidylyltransferase